MARSFAASATLIARDRMLLLGGSNSAASVDLARVKGNEIDIETVELRGEAPAVRAATLAASRGASVVSSHVGALVFGGSSSTAVFRIDCDSWIVEALPCLPSLSAPSPRAGHASVMVGDLMVVVGGARLEAEPAAGQGPAAAAAASPRPRPPAAGAPPLLCDVHCLHVDVEGGSEWMEPAVRGHAPAGRRGHSAVALGHCVLVFGGLAERGVYLDDLLVLDLASEEARWRQVETRGAGPSPRADHHAAVVGSCLLVAGGHGRAGPAPDAFLLDLETMAWAPVAPAPRLPALFGASVALLRNSLLALGGCARGRPRDSRHIYDLGPALEGPDTLSGDLWAARAEGSDLLLVPRAGGPASRAHAAVLLARGCPCLAGALAEAAAAAASAAAALPAIPVDLSPAELEAALSLLYGRRAESGADGDAPALEAAHEALLRLSRCRCSGEALGPDPGPGLARLLSAPPPLPFDATLVCTGDGAEIPAHRAVLAARGAFFRAALRGGTREAATGRVALRNWTRAPAGVLLRYLYTDRVEPESAGGADDRGAAAVAIASVAVLLARGRPCLAEAVAIASVVPLAEAVLLPGLKARAAAAAAVCCAAVCAECDAKSESGSPRGLAVRPLPFGLEDVGLLEFVAAFAGPED
eukprot:tig00000743_g3877.t1